MEGWRTGASFFAVLKLAGGASLVTCPLAVSQLDAELEESSQQQSRLNEVIRAVTQVRGSAP